MCTYITESIEVRGSGKGPEGQWLRVTDASVYFDHPVHALFDHTLNVDLRDPARGPAGRVALELSASSARRLAESILRILDAAPDGLAVDERVPAVTGPVD